MAVQPVQWMPAPLPVPGCPPGLEYLALLDQVIVKQEVSFVEAFTGFETKNKFGIFNSVGQRVYFAGEESGLCMRLMCGVQRGFTFHVVDNFNQPVFRVRRDFACCTGVVCCPADCCRYFAVVEDRNGYVLGYVSNLCFCCSPLFGVFDNNRTLVAEIRGPFFPIQNVCCSADIEFPTVDLVSGNQIGMIAKTWEGALKDIFTKADTYTVGFPVNLPVFQKALMIGAVFVIDMMLYERNDQGAL